jgi:cyclopropane fatty-acyl-phospholipid synthase-like methyltransferase
MNSYVTDERVPHLGGNIRYGDLSCISLTLWKTLIERFAIRSMLDVGCGEGHAVHYFHSQGVYAHGIDGLEKNVRRSVVPIALHDLTRGPYVMPVDLVISIEVAEHIEEQFVENYLDTLSNGSIVALTHAVPGQAGYHHVNCQPSEYWMSKMAARGYLLDSSNEYWKAVANSDKHPTHFGNSGLIFLAES